MNNAITGRGKAPGIFVKNKKGRKKEAMPDKKMKSSEEKICKSVLVVEDDEDIREAILDVLRSEGFSAEAAENGEEALRKLEDMPVPSLVLLDLMMPEMNGWEFLDAQKKDVILSKHKVVTISAVKSTQSLEDPTPLDIDGVLPKPLSLEGILEQAQKYCRGTKNTGAVATA